MATTPIEFRSAAGQTLTADLVAADDTVPVMADGSTPATGLSAAELTNGDGRYRVNYTGTATGHHTLHVKSGADVILVADYYVEDTTDVHYPVDLYPLS